MSHFHKMILKMLPARFLGWLATFMFLLLMQFLIKHLPTLVGKGLPFSAVAELIIYSLAYMVVLAVPMSVLIAVLMIFSKLNESKAYAVIKNSGVSFPQLVWPLLLVGMGIALFMGYFNNEILPEANFRARNLWSDIRQKKPGFELQPGVFYDGVNDYSILVQDIPPDGNTMGDVLIYDYSEGSRKRTEIKAAQGTIVPIGQSKLDLVLEDGEVHRYRAEDNERYEMLRFSTYRLSLELSDFIFERSDPTSGRRSDRTMRTVEMKSIVDSLRSNVGEEKEDLVATIIGATSHNPTATDASKPVPVITNEAQVFQTAAQSARSTRSDLDNARRSISWKSRRADQYAVEIHKKNSIATASFVFMLIGALIGVSIKRSGLGKSALIATGIFMFFWVTLVQGEKLADRGFMDPWLGMWIANIVCAAGAIFLLARVWGDWASVRGPFARPDRDPS